LSVMAVGAFAQEADTSVETSTEEVTAEEPVLLEEGTTEVVEAPAETEAVETEEVVAAEPVTTEETAETEVVAETAVEAEADETVVAEAPEAEAAVTEPIIEVTPEIEADAGVTPDSPFWGLERAMERISLALTFGKSAKAQKGLAHAQERLAEVQMMISQKRFKEAAEAEAIHDETLAEVEATVQDIESSDATDELAEVQDVEAAIAKHKKQVSDLNENIRVHVKGELTAEQQTMLDDLVESFKDSSAKVDISIKAKKDRTMVKVKLVEEKTNGQGKKVTVDNRNLKPKPAKTVKSENEETSAEVGETGDVNAEDTDDLDARDTEDAETEETATEETEDVEDTEDAETDEPVENEVKAKGGRKD
jgi:hypothetical protein